MSPTQFQPVVPEIRSGVLETAIRFARQSVASHLSTEDATISPNAYAPLLAEAREIGLVGGEADPNPAPGIWGPGFPVYGPSISLNILEAMARQNADAALWMHFEGLAAHLAPETEGPVMLALGESGVWPKPLIHAGGSGEVDLTIPTDSKTTATLSGSKKMVSAPPGAKQILTAAGGNRWAIGDIDPTYVKISPLGETLGFRACGWSNIDFSSAPQQVLETKGDKLRHYHTIITIHWLGLGAIALGIARRAVIKAGAYVTERYQGGKIIKELPAVQELLGVAFEKIAVLEALLSNADNLPMGAPPAMVHSAIVKKGGIEAACVAATNALQCFGGYGYMADYGVESCLRDVEMLRVMHGTPDRLQCLIYNFSKS